MTHRISRRGLLAGAALVGAVSVTGLGVSLAEAEEVGVLGKLPLIGPVGGNQIHVMTFNIRTAVDGGARSWKNRRPRVRKTIRQERPTILGTQEGRLHQIRDLIEDLPNYGCVRMGREADGTGETNAIFFDKARLEKLAAGHLWLSGTPKKKGSKTWGNKFPRMMTWVKFRDKATGVTFAHVNTHFDHASENSRRKSATMVRKRVKNLGVPTIITGDFNTGNDSVAHKTLTKGKFHNTWSASKKRITPAFGTANGWNPKPKKGGRRIDWILGTGKVNVVKVGINTWVTKNGNTASDHWPVQAVVTIG